MKLIYLKSALKCDSFDVAIGIKIPFFLEFWFLLSRVAPYYNSLPWTVWYSVYLVCTWSNYTSFSFFLLFPIVSFYFLLFFSIAEVDFFFRFIQWLQSRKNLVAIKVKYLLDYSSGPTYFFIIYISIIIILHPVFLLLFFILYLLLFRVSLLFILISLLFSLLALDTLFS